MSSGGGIVTQLGPAIPSLDPSLFASASYQHASIPQSNTFLTGTDALIQDTRSFQVPYAQKTDLGEGVSFTFFDAGHILGSAYVLLEWSEAGAARSLLFTCDVWRYNTPIIRDPVPPPTAASSIVRLQLLSIVGVEGVFENLTPHRLGVRSRNRRILVSQLKHQIILVRDFSAR